MLMTRTAAAAKLHMLVDITAAHHDDAIIAATACMAQHTGDEALMHILLQLLEAATMRHCIAQAV